MPEKSAAGGPAYLSPDGSKTYSKFPGKNAFFWRKAGERPRQQASRRRRFE